MIEFTITEENGIKWLNLKGRIDSMSSPEIDRKIKELILSGERTLVVNFEGVNYISSAGLRVFLSAQKQLKKVEGKIILYKLSQGVLEVFRLSGFVQMFAILSSKDEFDSVLQVEKTPAEVFSKNVEGTSIQYIKKETEPGTLERIGSQENLAMSEYTQDKIVSVKPADMQFGTGLAALGDNYEEYKNYFGESIIIDRNFFFYPALKRPAVDFMIYSQQESSLEYRFFHGFGFSGSYKYILSFENTEDFIELSRLVNILFDISETNLLGVVFLAESKGLWGMHLKRIPIIENKPENGKEIFAPENFSEWMNFPVEPSDINNIVVGTGIAVKDKDQVQPEIQELMSKETHFHIHGSVFEKEPFNKNIEQFENELKRITAELEVYKVQHILGQTRFSSGIVGIIELKG
ncbi:MAG: STAS domain-containing protein [Candidatus Aminicenantes bacterium]|nr:MAG: STAS domain-containing protein [Candidatus Aminicenantes bacterium]